MIGLLDGLKIGGGAAIGALLAAGPVYLYGHAAGERSAAISALETSVSILRERNVTDAEISAADAAGLCGYYGLSYDEAGECVRRLVAPDNDAGHGRQDHD